jgi:hypothetical protein
LRCELGLWFNDASTRRERLGTTIAVATAGIIEATEASRRVARRHGMLAVSTRALRAETRGIGSRLGAELGEVHVGSGAITEIHGLGQASLGVVAVEDDTVQCDGDDLNDDLDDDANQSPVLETAQEGVIDFVSVDS